ncbi:uncharacterized protein Tco025E_04990 [Trypanosoma conorhini]|uniref:PH domain-containing protein n=1 Tax=Trypanosoma conorhini TaxID=83891 RepID=A0A422PGZ5_9TRYP|nr:uncharacterized protein Tco025E_04990 [Trypanosoma conorhini]RNF16979.1 hypothetical protein Tco025E_04990 [Trypanosoma conorhini]
MRRNLSPTAFPPPRRREADGSRSLSPEAVEEGPWGGARGWERHEDAYAPHADYGAGRPRVSATLRPRPVKDAGLQRLLRRPRLSSRRGSTHPTDGAGLEEPRQQQRQEPSSSPHREQRGAIGAGDEAGAGQSGGGRRGWGRQPPSGAAATPSPRPLVDVRAAFGRVSSSAAAAAEPRDSRNASAGNGATAKLVTPRSASPLSPYAAASRDVGAARASAGPDWEAAAAAAGTTPPRVLVEQPLAEASTQDRYRGWKPSPCRNENTLTSSAWVPVHGTDGFSVIRSTTPGAEAAAQYVNPNAAAERILYMLLQQNEDAAPVAPSQPSTWNSERGGVNKSSESSPALFPSDAVARPRPRLQVTPQESRLLLGFLREKDREILQLRTSLAISYRFAAYAVHRQYPCNLPGVSAATMLSRGSDAAGGGVKDRKSDPMPWVNRAPPHIHGLPNVPLPLGLAHSVGQVCGVLSVMNVEDMSRKKIPARFFLGSWRTYFVVADDRGLAIYRSEEDYRQHAFQRVLVVVPFRDMEFFLPSFRDVSTVDEDLLDVDALADAPHVRQAGGGGGSSGGLFSALLRKAGGPKGEPALTRREPGAVAATNDDEERSSSSKAAAAADSQSGGGRASLYMRRRRPDRYDQLMTRIAIEHAGDIAHAYFGFIPKQPSTQTGSKAVNPPILFRTQSAQEHLEWAHYFAQCFNRKLYREMFPTAVAEAYAGQASKETQTASDTAEPAPLERRAANDEQEGKGTRSTVASEEVMAVAPCAAAASQTTPREQKDAATNTEEARCGEGGALAVTPPPPPTAPPKRSVIGGAEVTEVVYHAVEEPPRGSAVNTKEVATMVDVPAEEAGADHAPWGELVTELRGMLESRTAELQAVEQESEELRLRVRQLTQELRQLNSDRDNLRKEAEEVHATCDAEARRAQDAERDLQLAREAARAAEAARQEAVTREKGKAARVKKLEEEMACMQHEQAVLAAELLALKDGYSEGLRCLAKKALGDIDQMHDVLTAGEYLAALRGGDGGPPRTGDASFSSESSEEASSHHTLSPQRHRAQLLHAPPPAASLRQPPSASPRQGRKKQQRRPKLPHAASQNSSVQEHSSASKATPNARAPADAAGGALGLAMLLISFVPHQLAIDGCFTVDESQARLLRSGPSATRRGREWVMLHHDTNAVFAVTAELQPEKESRRRAASKSPAVCPGSSRPSRERLPRAVAGAKSAARTAPPPTEEE